MKKWLRRRGGSIGSFLLSLLAILYIFVIRYTICYRQRGDRSWRENEQQKRILTFWHGRTAGIVANSPRGHKVWALVSRSRDGDFIARFLRPFGIYAVRGSSRDPAKKHLDKGGTAGFLSLSRHIRQGKQVVIIPDGPRGPPMQFNIGAIHLAQKTGAKIYFVGISARRRKLWHSWDRFQILLPFTKSKIYWTKPLSVPENASAQKLEQLRQIAEQRLFRATACADRLCGHRLAPTTDIHRQSEKL